MSVHTFQTCLYHHCSSFNGVVLPFPPLLETGFGSEHALRSPPGTVTESWESWTPATSERCGAKFSHGISDETPQVSKRVSLATTVCLELVSPSVTKLQSSLFLWVVTSTLPTPRNLISALFGLLNPLSQCPMGTWDRIIHFYRNSPKAIIPAPFHALFLHSTFPIISAISTPPNLICHCCALCFSHFLPPKC